MTIVRYKYTDNDLWYTEKFVDEEDAFDWCDEAEQDTRIEAYECVENGLVYNQWERW